MDIDDILRVAGGFAGTITWLLFGLVVQRHREFIPYVARLVRGKSHEDQLDDDYNPVPPIGQLFSAIGLLMVISACLDLAYSLYRLIDRGGFDF